MKFLIEDIGDGYERLEENIKNSGKDFLKIKFIPFKMTFDLVLSEHDYQNYLPLSSVNTVLLGKKLGMKVFFESSNFDYMKFVKEYGRDFINYDAEEILYKDILDIKDDIIYLRDSVGDNIIKGKVFEKSEVSGYNIVYDQFLGRSNGESVVDDNRKIIKASPKNILEEYRFFVIKNRIVTASRYFDRGQLFIKNLDYPDSEENEIINFAWKMISKYSPDESFVIDIARMKNGDLKVVECNCLNCSGFYACDTKKIVDGLVDNYF